MVNQEILEGLRIALSRGYSLEQAMMSFFNAGYKKQEIEEAARALYTHPSHPLSHPGRATPDHLKKPVGYSSQRIETHTDQSPQEKKEKSPAKAQPKKLQQPQTQSETKDQGKTKEKSKGKSKAEVSKYEEKTKPKGKLLTILLIIALFVLISSLVGIFLFKEPLMEFFTNIFS